MLRRFSREPALLADLPTAVANPPQPVPEPVNDTGEDMTGLRVALHRHLLDEVNLSAIERADARTLAEELRPLVKAFLTERGTVLNGREIDALVDAIGDEMRGLGPIEPLLKDETIADILINGYNAVFVERGGVLERTGIRFKDDAHLMRIVHRIVAAVGRRVDEGSPMVDARLPDGSRVNVAVRPVAIDGPAVSIRKFSRKPFSLERLVAIGSMPEPIAALLSSAVKAKLSVLVSGGTGSGKTTALNALSECISHAERLITIEDAAELQLQQPHVVRLETRPPNVEGRGEIRQRELMKNALRMRPDRIILGEIRGDEAFDMLQAMNTGHEGSMATIHANTPRDAMARLEQMVAMAAPGMAEKSVRGRIAAAVNLVIQLQRLPDGARRMMSVSEVTGMEGDVIQMQEIVRFERLGVDGEGRINGRFRATGVRPRFLSDLAAHGLPIPPIAFDPAVAL